MSEVTDPARELADLCADLARATDEKGESFLAKKFNTTPWTAEFFEIIFAIIERIELLKNIVAELGMDSDFQSEAVSHLSNISTAFNSHSMNTPWKNVVNSYLTATNIQPVKMLSSQVRAKYQLPKLSKDERKALLEELDTFLSWLKDHQLKERDFVRQALIDGVTKFRFRLERLQWVGWGYALESLRDVLSAYMILERGDLNIVANPDAGAVLMKTKAVITSVFEKIKFAKDAVEAGDFVLKAYGATMIALKGTATVIGLIAH